MSLPASSPLPKAFKLVHRILSAPTSSNGLTTKEIIREALKAHHIENPFSASSVANASQAEADEPVIAAKGKGKAKAKGKNAVIGHGHGQKKNLGVNVVPDGHPFISSTYLKTRVLAVLKSQNLISKSVRRAPPSAAAAASVSASSTSDPSSSSASASTSTSGGSRPTFTWTLNETRPITSSSSSTSASASDLPTWDKSAHWDRLIAGEAPGKLHAELTELFALRKAEAKEQAFESKKARRSEREIWEWEDRADGITTRLERVHLNKRRGEGRPKKERRRIEAYEKYVDGLMGFSSGSGLGEPSAVVGGDADAAGQRLSV
ncbi:hypothetical protein IAT40_006142 [Kwoniella sp. CBS 6097]